jgi:hypothetical protein
LWISYQLSVISHQSITDSQFPIPNSLD